LVLTVGFPIAISPRVGGERVEASHARRHCAFAAAGAAGTARKKYGRLPVKEAARWCVGLTDQDLLFSAVRLRGSLLLILLEKR